MKNIHHNKHNPVLLKAVLKYLVPKPGNSYLDLTAGYGGHAKAIEVKTKTPAAMVLVDRDQEATDRLKTQFEQARIIGSDFLAAATKLHDAGQAFDMIFMDLGVSSPHFDRAERGFSLKREGPLDMRMDQSQSLKASQIVNEWPEQELARIITEYGQQPGAKTIANAIAKARPVSTTKELADIVARSVKSKGYLKIHPATRTFQALRIAVNDELDQLDGTLRLLPELLKTGGRLAIISFHSLEDAKVKHWLKEESGSGYESRLKLLTKKPVKGEIDDVLNPRARSAKLRAAVKIKTERNA